MVNNRNGFTYAANITVLTVSLVLFIVISNSTTCFTVLCLICCGLGGCTTVFYSITINEKVLTNQAAQLEKIYRASLSN